MVQHYEVHLTDQAEAMLEEIQDRRIRSKVADRMQKLEEEPEKQGKPLVDELTEYRSVRAVGQRYRVIYRILEDQVEVLVVGTGLRKVGDKNDVYARLRKLFR